MARTVYLHMLELIVGNSLHIIRFSTGSVNSYCKCMELVSLRLYRYEVVQYNSNSCVMCAGYVISRADASYDLCDHTGSPRSWN